MNTHTEHPELPQKGVCENDVCMVGSEQKTAISQNMKNAIHLATVGLLLVVSWLLGRNNAIPPHFADSLSLLVVLLGYPIYLKAAKSILKGKIGVPLFVTISEIASVSIGAYWAAGTVVFIILAGTYLEDFILGRTRSSIRKLVEMTPRTARLVVDEQETWVDVRQLRVGDLVLVKPGEKIPVDGTVVSGYGAVDQSLVTGESMPVDKAHGNQVFAGSLNQGGALKINVEKLAEDTTLARMIHLVEDAQEKKAPIQNIADRFTTYFLPAILIFAAAVYIFTGSLERGVTILLVACPCAMSMAVPIAVIGAIGNAGRRGILIKGGTFVERLKGVDTIVFDKTGTLTFGMPQVTDILCFDGENSRTILEIAAIGEKYSEHPLGRAILAKAKEEGINTPDPESFEAIPGKGVMAQFRAQTILIGTMKFMEENRITVAGECAHSLETLQRKGATALLVAHDNRISGAIAVSDVVKHGLAEEISSLRSIGIKRIAMLSGDNHLVSEAVAASLGITEVASGLLPEEKVSYINKLKEEGRHVVMVGDGVNDAPALAVADVGMAMGTAGTDVAIEAADVSLLGDDLSKVRYSIGLSRKAFQKMQLNIVFAILWNALGLTLATLGYLTPVLGAVLQEAGCISVVINSALLLLYHESNI